MIRDLWAALILIAMALAPISAAASDAQWIAVCSAYGVVLQESDGEPAPPRPDPQSCAHATPATRERKSV